MTTSQVAAVRVSPGLTIQTRADPQLPQGYRIAIAVDQTAGRSGGGLPTLPSPRSAVALNDAGKPFGLPVTHSSLHDASVYWQPHRTRGGGSQPKRHTPPPGGCEINTAALSGVDLFFGWVVPRVEGFPQLAGRPFLSCAITEFGYDHAGAVAAILVDAKHPGSAPAPLPGATPVPGKPDVFNQPAVEPPPGTRALAGDFAITARRIGNAWLVVQASGPLDYRLAVLSRLSACVHVTGSPCAAGK